MIRPAFASTRQAAAFALLLLVLLLLPALMNKSLLPSREEIYSAIWWFNGPYPYIDQQIFNEKGDIDIAFVGSSHMLDAIDTPYVQEKLSEKLGRPAVVRSICWGGPGYDALYFIAQDLLQHRKVHTLVFYDESHDDDSIYPLAPRLFRLGDDPKVLVGLSAKFQMWYYFAAVIGMPRNVLGLIRSNISADVSLGETNSLERIYKAPNIASQLGSLSIEVGFESDPAGIGPATASLSPDFVEFVPHTNIQPSDALIYSSATKDMFQFSENSASAIQLHFARQFTMMAQRHGSALVLLHIPIFAEIKDPFIREREMWPEILHTHIDMLGIPSAKLFSGLTDREAGRLFYNQDHLNKNGRAYFTWLITPSLLELYAAQTHN